MAMHFVTQTMPIDSIDGKDHKLEPKCSRNYESYPIIQIPNHAYDLGGVHTVTHLHTETRPADVFLV